MTAEKLVASPFTLNPRFNAWHPQRCSRCGSTEIVCVETHDITKITPDRMTCREKHYCVDCGSQMERHVAACASMPDPAGVGHCWPSQLAQVPDRVKHYQVCGGGSSWLMTRYIYETGQLPAGEGAFLPHGPFLIELHSLPLFADKRLAFAQASLASAICEHGISDSKNHISAEGGSDAILCQG